MSAPRIASLVPSITELLIALGLGPNLVARTGFCIHPAAALADVPKVGGTKDVNLAKLRRLAPSHVIVNVDENRLETVQALREFVPHIVVTHPQGPEDNQVLLAQLLALFAEQPGVAEAVTRLQAELGQALARCAAEAWPAQRVLYLIWRQPWMTVARDTYIARMLAQVGWQSWPELCGGESGAARYPVLRGDEAWLGRIDRVLLSSEPYRFDASHLAEAQALCPQARVQLVDGELLSWYGPRAAAGLDYLRGLASA
ncbi:ABC-type Fe3+-hydroxamate transport system substrate-binding protein [Paucibacter oligotrophus]|uniref:ABC-type Fe3+-hydroxamate transport system substrate-binding protein n=1 Tax=Roseateles oligotrophus TaxID=1769250 RepID=A0A840L2W7_9BURK|nr:helical backbone metal receptor [Roseateles oligotrophus]MBB4842580.1 ABC-type Fe3+-hydroxamate transport system substrate-binding protein [Roseateles oligotrophus]